jgi:hypothetical protein
MAVLDRLMVRKRPLSRPGSAADVDAARVPLIWVGDPSARLAVGGADRQATALVKMEPAAGARFHSPIEGGRGALIGCLLLVATTQGVHRRCG